MEPLITWVLIVGLVLYNGYRLCILIYTWSRRNDKDLDEVDREHDYATAKETMVSVLVYDGLLIVVSVAAFVWKSS